MATLTIVPAPTFTAPARIHQPGGGAVEIPVTWRHMGRKAFAEWAKSSAADARQDVDVLLECMAGWDEVDQPFSREALEALLDAYPCAAMDLFQAYQRALFEARGKN